MANFGPVNRVETSARLLKQILLKSNCRLHGEGFSPGRNSARAENPSLVCSNRARKETIWLELESRRDFSGI